jgi:ATP-binding cassette, subfamily B, bacterial
VRLPSLVRDSMRLVRAADPRTFWSGAVLQIVSAMCATAIVVASKLLLDGLVNGHISTGALVIPVIVFAGATALTTSTTSFQNQQQRLLVEQTNRLVWRRLLGVTTRVDLQTYERPDFFDRLQRIQNNALTRPTTIALSTLSLLGNAVGLVSLLAVVFVLQPLLVPPLLLGALPTIYLARRGSASEFRFFAKYTAPFRRRGYIRQTLSDRGAAKEIRVFDAAPLLIERENDLSDEYIAGLRVQVRRRQLLSAASSLISAGILAGTLWLVVILLVHGWLSLSSAAAALIAVRVLAGQLNALFNAIGGIVESGVFLSDLDDFVSNTPLPPESDAQPRALTDRIELHNVSYRYPSGTAWVVRNVDLRIGAGEIVALVGENGSGKTTLAKIVGGLYPAIEGSLSWDGATVDPANRAALQASVSVIFQDFMRYHLSATDNIVIGDHRRAEKRDDLRDAAERAGADAFLEDLPAGYATLLSREYGDGVDLSLGQWQRVALARALFKDAPLLILDEASASLDPRAEHALFADIRRSLRDKAALVISHRYANLHLADRIYVMQSGHIVESGSHTELLTLRGLYAELYHLQADAYQTEVEESPSPNPSPRQASARIRR